MRFMIIRKSDKYTESGLVPGREMLTAMGKYREALDRAGVLISGEGLLSSAKGARVVCESGNMTVMDGPFAESKELVAGFLVIEVDSIQDAVEWAKRCPSTNVDCRVEMEVRQVADISDFPTDATPMLCGIPWTSVSADARARLNGNK
jgi:hypothetical protein